MAPAGASPGIAFTFEQHSFRGPAGTGGGLVPGRTDATAVHRPRRGQTTCHADVSRRRALTLRSDGQTVVTVLGT